MKQFDNFVNRPRRSCLYTPANNGKAMEKARHLPFDAIIFDLEDAVDPDQKSVARDMAAQHYLQGGYGNREIIIRINAIDSLWGKDDLTMINHIKPDAILLPKVNCANDIYEIDALLDDDIALWVMIETPLAILNIHEIAKASIDTKLSTFVIGTNDLAKEMRAYMSADRHAFAYALGATIMAARAYGLIAIDGVYNDFKNTSGLESECNQGRILGFDGKSLIHPAQIEIANRIFAPNAQEVQWALAIIEAFSLPENKSKGVINIDGKMTERLHFEEAKRIIALHSMIDCL